jgi:hypothetical protein
VSRAEILYDESNLLEHKMSLQEAKAKYAFFSLKAQECFWRDKGSVKWLNKGDANARFFHSFCQIKRK